MRFRLPVSVHAARTSSRRHPDRRFPTAERTGPHIFKSCDHFGNRFGYTLTGRIAVHGSGQPGFHRSEIVRKDDENIIVVETRAPEVGNATSGLRVEMIKNACKFSLKARNEPTLIAACAGPFRDSGISRDQLGVPWNRTGFFPQVNAP